MDRSAMIGLFRGGLLALALPLIPPQADGSSTGVVQVTVTPVPVTETTTTTVAIEGGATAGAPAVTGERRPLAGTGADAVAVALTGAALAGMGGVMSYAARRRRHPS